MARQYLAPMALSMVLVAGCGGGQGAEPAEPSDDRTEIGDRGAERTRRVPDVDQDDDPDLEIAGLRGHLDPYDIQKGVTPHQGALAGCFENNARRRKFIGGAVELSYLVARDGSVKTVRVSESDLGSWPVERCLLETARQMQFVEPKGGEADFSLPLEFPATRAVQVWDADQASLEVEERLGELSACTAETAVAAPGELVVTVYVGTRGQVQSAGFATTDETPLADAWADCAEAKILAWQLSDPRGRIAKLAFRFDPE